MLRQLVMERLVTLDCDQQAPLAVVTARRHRAGRIRARRRLPRGLRRARRACTARRCAPDGQRAQLWVVGMGKLGARELNVSSDIDLIYVYDHDGETAGNAEGRGRITNHEYFAQGGQGASTRWSATPPSTASCSASTWRCGPTATRARRAVSLDALEEYFQVQGREWERFAWLKSRVVAPRACIDDGSAQALRGAVLPFVFRRYLDYSVFDALRVLHRQIREHAARRSAGRPERANDVKLSRGGIREIEFTVQLLQVVRGGQFPELRTRPDAARRCSGWRAPA